MRPAKVTQIAAGDSSWIPLDMHISPFNVGFGCVVTGTVNYTVQHTFDDPSGSPVAFDHASVAAQTTNKDGNYAFPIRAVRVRVNSGTGNVDLTVIQAGVGG